jgi:hypothetical protein
MTILKRVRASLGGEIAADNLDPIVVLDRSSVRVASLMLETAYEGRAVLDLKFGTIETNSDPVGIIDTVKVELKITRTADVLDETITLPNE